MVVLPAPVDSKSKDYGNQGTLRAEPRLASVDGKTNAQHYYGSLTIEPRLLITEDQTIAIPNIAWLSVGSEGREAIKGMSTWASALLIGAVLLFLAGLLVAMPYKSSGLFMLALILPSICVVIAITLPQVDKVPERRTYSLKVVTADGRPFLFEGTRKETIDTVRRIISDNINDQNTTTTYNVNLKQGGIENMSIGSIGAVVSGSNNQVTAGAGNARVGTSDTHMTVSNSPGAQLGDGHIATGNSYHVDYSQALPEVENLQRFYAQHKDTEELAGRLSELEHLMRSGTPTPQGRGRLRQLASDLSSILQAYPPVVQLFQHIAHLAGF